MKKKTFEAEIFQCRQCGACCHGETTVSLDDADVSRMLAALGMEKEAATRKFWRITGSTVQMKIIDGHCIFYCDGCTIHQGKPWRCGQWPLHPSILIDPANFTAIRSSCPGINQELSYEEFCARLKELLAVTG